MIERVRETLARMQRGRLVGRCAECGRKVHENDDYVRIARVVYHREHVRYVSRK